MSSQSLIAVDPGLGSTGWALFDERQNLVASGTIHAKGETVPEKIADICHRLTMVLNEHGIPERGIVEIPSHFSFSRARGANGTGNNQNSLHKLNRGIGGIIACLASFSIPVEEVLVSTWKNTKTKAQVHTQGQLLLPKKKTSEDERDAIMMGFWKLGMIRIERLSAKTKVPKASKIPRAKTSKTKKAGM